MNYSMRRADAGTHFKIVATALMAATLVIWIGIAARVSPTPPANWTYAPAKPATMPVEPPIVPMQPSLIAMAESQRS
jgi:hypothetical protein